MADALGVPLTGAGWPAAEECADADVVISTVPKGVADHLQVPWRAKTVLFDALYDPWPTPLAASAQRAGNAIVSGLDLLLNQALGQFEQFTGVAAPGRGDARGTAGRPPRLACPGRCDPGEADR